MRITSLSAVPLAELPYLNAGRRRGEILEDRLPVLEATVDQLPPGVEALVATADLQFREKPGGRREFGLRLLGETLPAWLAQEALPRCGLMDPQAIGVLLCGDFYTVPGLDQRGGSGDVTEVWRSFRDEFGWVAGVAGNHDTFGPHCETRPRFPKGSGMFALEGDLLEVAGLRVAGLGGIIGPERRIQRRAEDAYQSQLAALLEQEPDLVLTHDGPDGPHRGQKGVAAIREIVELSRPVLMIRGHAHWSSPLAELRNGAQVLNVDSRVVLLRPG